MLRTLHFLLPLCCLPSVSLAADVIQTPKLLVSHSHVNISMTCEHNDSSKYTKLWYRQKMGKELVLMGLTTYQDKPQMETGFNVERFTIYPERTEKSILKINNVTVEDNAVYYCASTTGSNYQAYFGEGTILAVLGNGEVQKNPKVKIFPPNKREFQDHSLISLVCVATGFFPEHVRLTWFVNDVLKEDVYQNVPTKNEDGTYSTSKRLSLTKSEYFNPDSTFKCKAGFIGDEPVSDEIKGESDCGVSKEHFTMIINQGKISYIMVLFKSGLYALIVLAIIWRKKVLSGSC